MKSNNPTCSVPRCGVKLCPICGDHIFPPNQTVITASDRAHYPIKKMACHCTVNQRGGARKYERRK